MTSSNYHQDLHRVHFVVHIHYTIFGFATFGTIEYLTITMQIEMIWW